MEIKTLRCFLAVAELGSMTRASEILHLSQPALSKRISALEDELGRRLFVRHSFSLELSDDGRLLRDKAKDLVGMAARIKDAFPKGGSLAGGTVSLGLAESLQIRYLARAIRAFSSEHPGFRYHISSGDTEQVVEKLDKGLLDYAALCQLPDPDKYGYVEFPEPDVWGLVMPKGHSLAAKKSVTFEDLRPLGLFCSQQSWDQDIPRWCGSRRDELTLKGTFRLSYNGSIFVEEGMGFMLTFKGLVDSRPWLTFRPLEPPLTTPLCLIWRKDGMMAPVCAAFLECVKSCFAETNNHKS